MSKPFAVGAIDCLPVLINRPAQQIWNRLQQVDFLRASVEPFGSFETRDASAMVQPGFKATVYNPTIGPIAFETATIGSTSRTDQLTFGKTGLARYTLAITNKGSKTALLGRLDMLQFDSAEIAESLGLSRLQRHALGILAKHEHRLAPTIGSHLHKQLQAMGNLLTAGPTPSATVPKTTGQVRRFHPVKNPSGA